MRILRSLLSLLIVLALFGGGLTYALTPSESIKTSEKLANVQAATTVQDLNSDLISNVGFANSKLSTSLKLDNKTFLSIFKNAVEKDSELLNGSYKLVGNHIEAKLPVKLGLWDTIITTNIRVVGANNGVELILEDAKIGKVPIPDFALEKYLKEALTGTGVGVNGNLVSIKALGLPVNVDSVELSGGNINVTASLTQQQVLQYTADALKNLRRG
ncbi:hypothetical protein [uncultured Gemella sp.]|uniref:hypothetical protein n=1 Tax=uncultured Gemella sp. TaxID=254352 RepID=UPI0028D3DD06|nr:hypothetical protein [uncultured Gemella sp.]